VPHERIRSAGGGVFLLRQPPGARFIGVTGGDILADPNRHALGIVPLGTVVFWALSAVPFALLMLVFTAFQLAVRRSREKAKK